MALAPTSLQRTLMTHEQSCVRGSTAQGCEAVIQYSVQDSRGRRVTRAGARGRTTAAGAARCRGLGRLAGAVPGRSSRSAAFLLRGGILGHEEDVIAELLSSARARASVHSRAAATRFSCGLRLSPMSPEDDSGACCRPHLL